VTLRAPDVINARIEGVPEIKAVEPKKNYRNWLFKRFDSKKLISEFFALLTLVGIVLFVGFNSSAIGLNANFIKAQVGDEADVAIYVKDEALISSLMNDNGIIKASFPDNNDAQPNITLIIQPNSFLSVPAAAKMKIHVGQDVKAGMYRIAVDVLQGFNERNTFVFVEVVTGNRTN
jgi:hypothetical protein